ncbi:MAG: hypothetical protein WB564_00770 [Dehalococcoidia bacterium]
MRQYTNLNSDELEGYLEKIRRIAKMDNDDALLEVDELIYNLALRGAADPYIRFGINSRKSDHSVDVDGAKQELREFRNKLEDIRKSGMSGLYEEWDEETGEFISIGELANRLGEDWPKSVKDVLHEEITQIRQEAHKLVDGLQIREYSDDILASKKRNICNISSVRGILKTLSYAEDMLREKGALNDELCQEIHRERERCAWFRAKRKFLEIEVAEKSGNRSKAARLKREAQVILEQDWRNIFPNEQCPNIDLIR